MKLTIQIFLSSAFTAATVLGQMRDSATHEQLAVSYQIASQNDPVRKLAPAKGPDPTTANPQKSLLSNSDVICFNGMATLVPKRAVLQTPKNMADRFKYIPGAKLLSWADFYALNRGWISTMEVSRIQAEGNSPLTEDACKLMSKSANLIIATYQAGPISVLPLKVPAEKSAEKTATGVITAKGPKS